VKRVGLRAGEWSSSGLPFMETFAERLRGVRISVSDRGLVIPRKAVHSVGLSRPLELVAVGKGDRVVEVRTLAPNRFAWFRGAEYVIELPGGSDVPAVGSIVEMTHGD
jgi:hypothetical protein